MKLNKSWALVLAVCMLLVSACNFAIADEKTTIGYISWNGGAQQTAEEEWFERYEEEHPDVDVNSEYLSWDNYYSKLNTLIAADSCPDIFFSSEDTLINYADKGLALNLEPYFEAKGVDMKEVFHPTTMYSNDEGTYSIANGVSCMALFYNKALFAEKGIEMPSLDAENPWTWEQFVEAAKALTEDANGLHPGDERFDANSIRTFGTMAPTGRNAWMPLLYSNGGSIFNEDATGLNLDTPEAKEVFQAIADLMLVDKVAPTAALSKSLPAIQQMFKDNQLGMAIDGAWSYLNFKTDDIDVGIAPLPAFDKPVTIAWASAYLLSSQSKNPQEAFDLLYDFISIDKNPDQLTFMSGPNTLDSYTEEGLQEWLYQNDFYNDDYRAVIPQLLTKTAIAGENILVDCYTPVAAEIVDPALEQVWLGTASLEDVIAQCYETTADIFSNR